MHANKKKKITDTPSAVHKICMYVRKLHHSTCHELRTSGGNACRAPGAPHILEHVPLCSKDAQRTSGDGACSVHALYEKVCDSVGMASLHTRDDGLLGLQKPLPSARRPICIEKKKHLRNRKITKRYSEEIERKAAIQKQLLPRHCQQINKV
jgi:hypothetical protein